MKNVAVGQVWRSPKPHSFQVEILEVRTFLVSYKFITGIRNGETGNAKVADFDNKKFTFIK